MLADECLEERPTRRCAGEPLEVEIHAHPPTVERSPERDAMIQRLASALRADWSAASLDAAISDIRGQPF